MKANTLNNNTKTFDGAVNHTIAPGMYIIARLQGRGILFHDHLTNNMIDVTEHLMTCGFNVTYGHTTGDEISLPFHIDEDSYRRGAAEIVSVLAGEASARLTYIMRQFATFDCTLIALANKKLVKDYFLARSANVSTVNVWSYWKDFESGRRELVTVSNQKFQDILYNVN